ncbi:MAG: acyl-CoA synthetase FdrA [Tissierellia bacterium]|nr:acyl-CoA synthetase FdrA [Tissierellia bacterium]
MLITVIKKDMYKDSVALMLLNNKINAHPAVNVASIMMATPANKDMFKESGLLTDEVEKAGANDIAIVLDLDDETELDGIVEIIDEELSATEKSSAMSGIQEATTLPEALEILPEANLAMISVPGIYAYSVGKKCLDQNLNLFIFSDNVPLEEEIQLKKEGREKGLIVMGPDCGTSIIKGVPLAFANQTKSGKIGIVGASGTGIQEVTSILDGKGYGITNAIGTGGRDLSEEVGAMTFLKGVENLMDDDETEVILVLSKPPAKEVREKVEAYLKSLTKPVASLFLGETPDSHFEGYYRAGTLEELAILGIDLLENKKPETIVSEAEIKDANGTIKGLYTGGTLATEAALLIERGLNINEELTHEHGYILNHEGFEVIDLGDDEYTQGKPHPMIDPTARLPYILKAAEDKNTKVIVLDVVLGFGANEDPASTLVETIKEVKSTRPDIDVVTTICGTKQDPQNINEQEQQLKDVGATVFHSNRQALDHALGLIGKKIDYKEKPVLPLEKISVDLDLGEKNNLLNDKLQIINIGLESFANNLKSFDAKYVQYNFTPIAGGKKELMRALEFLEAWRGTNE